jgi:hypothetical protein
VPLLLLALLIPFFFLVLLPFSIVQRYRAGTSRRVARGWIATANVFAIAFSILIFVVATAVTTIWLPGALTHAAGGLVVGGIVGVVGLALTKWENTGRGLHYTPNRWLVLALTVIVATRLLYGLWRAWQLWGAADSSTSWLLAAGTNGSLAAGAVILGYYLIYWAGISRRAARGRRLRVVG